MTREEQIEALRAKLRARKGRPGFEANAAEIEKRIAKLESEGGDE